MSTIVQAHAASNSYNYKVYNSCSRTYNLPSGKNTAQNGFVNVALEEDHVDGDVYTTDGPLQSGTQSLRRISTKSRVSCSF